MTGERWVVLGVARPRSPWFRDVSRWASSAAVPFDFVRCLSTDEAKVRLESGRPYSALLVGSDVIGLDRDLIDAATSRGTAVISVGDRDGPWADLGATVLPTPLDQATLVQHLGENARPIPRIDDDVEPAPTDGGGFRGRLIAVLGPGGAGSSTVAMAAAQGLADRASHRGLVALADLALDADQALFHDTREIVPGVLELVEAHRGASLEPERTRAMTFEPAGRGYQVLLGLRRHRDWTAIRPRAFDAALASLLSTYRLVVADIDADVEGRNETGSADIEDRNRMARATASAADLVVVVGDDGTKGLHSLLRIVHRVVDCGVESGRVLAVVNRCRRSPRHRAAIVASLAGLLGPDLGAEIGNPVLLSNRRDLATAVRDAARVPRGLVMPIVAAVSERLAHLSERDEPGASAGEPVAAGSVGHWVSP